MDILPGGLVDSAIEWADGLGYLGLAILTFTEAALQPIPPDPLVWSMILEANNGFVVATVVLIATLSSVLGALAGYGIGMYGGGWFLEKFVSESTIARLNVLVERYGSAGIFIAAVSPIPYKALAWIAGAGRMDLRLFVAAGIVGRGLRFGIPGALLGIYGESMKSSMTGVEGAITFSIVSILGLIIVIPASRWWKGLLVEEE
ncbi:MAG: VTT domain-containing protein [Candidatus Thermoplasmatota archaeon]|jgi:membrane protein YqaA with SNARE-associated domain|nr:VTT domain-containing protein [Candidatus Thermoplasmatota archaeon]MED5455249.1 VTT domain-containing protein [Candidatus Thermoplasmatota archaeon]|tara:strand:- start:110 stop:718 length:609 start_codon:yes stop_codon:yes gene_type:complete